MTTYSIEDYAISDIQNELAHLSILVNQAIGRSVKALMERDETRARHVSTQDSVVNKARCDIEEHCYALLGTQRLNLSDLHMVVGTVNIATNLERIGDHAAGIAYLSLRLKSLPYIPYFIPAMAEIAQEMVEGAVNAFLNRNDLLAERLVRRDREIEELHEQVISELAGWMTNDAPLREPALRLSWASYNLVRIADRAANICERTIYITTGELKEFR